MIERPPLTQESTIYRCTGCKRAIIYADLDKLGCCSLCGGHEVKYAFQVSDDELKAAIDRGLKYDETNFTYVSEAMLRENKLPGLHELFRDVEKRDGR